MSSAGQTNGTGHASALWVGGLQKAFGAQAVLQGIDLEVPRGSVAAILGPSGSGKTTLLRVIAGFETADAGTVSLCGRVVDGPAVWVPPERRGIGYVPQESGLFPHLTVAENISFGLERRRRRARRDPRAQALLEMVGLAGLDGRYPHELSGGQQQRVALARALAIEPDLVLLDEPFSSLDVALRSAVREDVRRVLADAGTTAVLVTHDQDEALSMADVVALIRQGRIGQVGPPEEIYASPADPDIATFVGDANLLLGRLEGDGVRTAVGTLELHRPVLGGRDGAEVTVLVRPEQISIVEPSQGVLKAEVVRAEFYGHDCIITARPLDPAVGGPDLVARAQGGVRPVDGATVGLAAAGATIAWASRA